ncbi:MAG: 30S ribosomal protein S20 [Atribacterota bacterium]
MPRIKSAIKRVKTAEKSHLRNITYKSKIKTNIKKFNLALEEKNENDVIKYFKDSVSSLDKAVDKGILPKGAASRKKSRLSKKLNILTKPTQVTEIEKTTEAEKKPIAKEPTKTVKKTVAKKISKPTKKAKAKETTKVAKKTVAKSTKKSVKKKTETKSE